MKETTITIILPKGFKNGIQISQENIGHQHIDGRIGNVIVTIKYGVPFNWQLFIDTSNILYNKLIPLDYIFNVFFFNITTPFGDIIEVKMPKIETVGLDLLLQGFNITLKNYGLLLGNGDNDDKDDSDKNDDDEVVDLELINDSKSINNTKRNSNNTTNSKITESDQSQKADQNNSDVTKNKTKNTRGMMNIYLLFCN